jgi:hypothetical protein
MNDYLEQMTDGLITLEEGRERYLKAGGNLADFEAFVELHREDIATNAEAFGEE